ncbi:MAG: hypothetical protein HUK00_08830 [Bacteroidaceae bacterium]|nr:hypothetical protein [Bacteroidaceae bacterium]
MSPKINRKEERFDVVLNNYIQQNDGRISSFDTYITDNYRHLLEANVEDIKHIFGEIIANMVK